MTTSTTDIYPFAVWLMEHGHKVERRPSEDLLYTEYVVEDQFVLRKERKSLTYTNEGWWHPNVKSGQVHLHPADGGESRGWSVTMHQQCEPVYTRRKTK